MIHISATQLQKIYLHAEITYPEECCGLLLGTFEKADKIVLEVRETENSWTPEMVEGLPNIPSSTGESCSKKNRFTIDPYTILQVQKEARDRSLNIIGVYHSHPNYPAIPSAFDLEIAWSQYSYIIASLKQGKVTDIQSWQLHENRQFQSENMEII
ncbi:MAG: M67 family metallopeptidase [Crocosphaera sp.]